MDFLQQLGIGQQHPGACWGFDDWSAATDTGRVTAVNPATGEAIATVHGARDRKSTRLNSSH